jgi:small subunit ribosomal protein S20
MRNKAVKTRVKTVVKEVRQATDEKSLETAPALLNTAKSVIDKAAKKGIISKKTAARKVSRLTKKINQINV